MQRETFEELPAGQAAIDLAKGVYALATEQEFRGHGSMRHQDDNLMIIENVAGLASEYAVNMLGVFGHYKWLYALSLKKTASSKPAAKTFAAVRWQLRR
ncbi:MAG: hypothetical protein EPN47_12745 [Acidobacteria bacterium]|nr:MAG: hypothetical protein EPN47_12745 [Acidobacteriota bacterium]